MMSDHPAEEIPVDAYSSYIMHITEARTGELRREAAEYAMSRTARRPRVSRWTRTGERLRRRQPDPVVALRRTA